MHKLSRKFALSMLFAMLVQISSPYLYLTSTLVFAESNDETTTSQSVTPETSSSSSSAEAEPAPVIVESVTTSSAAASEETSSSSSASSSSESASSSSSSSATAESTDTPATEPAPEGRVSSSSYDAANKEFTVSPVELGVTYIFPGNKLVKIRFAELPTNPGYLKIKEITLNSEQREKLDSVSSKAYEFTSDMKDGSFTYEITLPKGKARDAEVKYAENLSGLNNPKSEESSVRDNVVVFTADHFTIFVVTDDQATTSGGAWDDYAGQGSSYDVSNGVHYPFFTTATGDITWGFTGLGLSNYDVYISWSTHPNRTQSAEYTVNYVGGSQAFTVNQELLADQTTVGGSGEFSGWYKLNGPLAGGQFQLDATSTLVLPTKDNASGTEYVIGDEVILANAVDNGSFIGSPKYVRENNATDVSAEVHVNTLVEDVRFYLDGVGPVAGTYINAVNASLDRWRLLTAVAAGEYTVTAEVQIAGTWYALAGSSTLYSLDIPSFEYISPSSDPQFFRPTDNPVRVKVDDEFNQFESIALRVYDYSAGVRGALLFTYTINRAECNLTQAGNYVLCDINDSLAWANLAEGRYDIDAQSDTLANNGVRYTHANSDSLPFYVDATAPLLNSFNITTVLTSPYTVYSTQIAVTANATDTAPGEVKHVEFYMRTPRSSDGACVDADSAGPIIKLTNNAKDGDDTYINTFDTSDLNGDYCLFAKAEDLAASHSVASNIKVTIDNVAPVVEITNPADNTVVSGTVAIRGSYTDVNPLRYYTVVRNSGNVNVAGPGTVNIGAGFTDQLLFNWNTTLVPDGTYTVRLEARDAAGNRDNAAGSQDVHTVIVDNTDPVVTNVKMFVNSVETTWVKAGDSVTWRYTITEANGIDTAASDILSGNVANPAAQEITSGGLTSCTNIAPSTYECDYTFTMPAQYVDTTNITTVTDDQITGGTVTDSVGNESAAIPDLTYTYYIPGAIQGRKYRDLDMNGNFDAVEQVNANRLNNWTIRLYNNSWTELDTGITGDDASNFSPVGRGQYRFGNLLPGTYYVCEDLKAGWQQFEPSSTSAGSIANTVAANGTYCRTITFDNNGGTMGAENFGNIDLAKIQGRKIYDVNGNGSLADETITDALRLDGWTINLYDSSWNPVATTTTGTLAKGQYTFDNLIPANYYVCEVSQAGWLQTYPYDSAMLEDNAGAVVQAGIGIQNDSGVAGEAGFCWDIRVEHGETQPWARFGNVEAATVTFTKNVVDELPTDIADATTFQINMTGVGTQTFAEGSSTTFVNLLPGTYSFTEIITDPAKYNLLYCMNGQVDAVGEVTVAAGEDVTIDCTNELVELPDVEVTPASDTIVENTDLLLTALIINDGTGPTYTLEWKCIRQSDGATVQGITTDPTKTVNFANTGTFKCTVTITDANGDKDSATATITVTSAVVDLDPQVVLFGTAPATNNGQINVTANTSFNVIASLSQAGNPGYTYQFGGVCTGSSNTGSTSFASNALSLAAGTYTCTVLVTDTDGDTDSASVTINVSGTGGGIGDSGDDDGSVQGETDGEIEEPTETPTTPPTDSTGQTCTTTVAVFGYIYVDMNKDSGVDSGDKRLGGLTVNIFNTLGVFVTSATTDNTGYWEKQLCPGDYRFDLVSSNLPSDAQVLGASSRTENVTGNDQVDFVFNQVASQTTDLSTFFPWLLLLLLAIFAGGIYAYARNNQRER
jgi:hypothetical protein